MAKKSKETTTNGAAQIVTTTTFADGNGKVFHMDVKTRPAPVAGKIITASKDGRVKAVSISR